MTTAVTLGGTIGCLGSAPMMKKGRRLTLIIGCVITLVSYAFVIEINPIAMSIGKLLQCIGSSLIECAIYEYVAETAPTKWVNLFLAFPGPGFTIGIASYFFLSNIVPEDPSELKNTEMWRYLWLLPQISAMILLALFTFVFKEDSVLFLVAKGKHDEALIHIKRIYKPVTETRH